MRKFYIRLLRLVVHTIGRLSDGITICLGQGLISGKMLDYVYRNQASGKLLIGKFIDRIFLSHRGWECIRMRKRHLEELLDQAVQLTWQKSREMLVLDVASGPALYILNILARHREKHIRAVCRDMDERWLAEGRRNAANMGLSAITFAKGDALDPAGFRSLPAADIGVSSGFYDWIVDDDKIRQSIKLIFDALKPGGYFVFTIQTGHVDMQMVSEIFPDFNQQPLRMTVRPAEGVNGWSTQAGFKVLKTLQDKWGYYAVTLAQKIS
ncbi:class I SAM-dependent methyltransferase family protein [candidate division FCPU426 bacterium]|nr:class I SAM-dependent methyltransferase family protein [candidate division FCPU426 bacterium]